MVNKINYKKMYNGPHRKKLRLEKYNYSQNGFYFVTICSYKKQCYFGEILNGKMVLNNYGELAQKYLEEIPKHYLKSEIDSFIIMPNHIHGIIIINNELKVGDENFRPLQSSTHKTVLSKKIKGFKIGCTKEIRKKYQDFVFAWQRSFYDVIIKNDEQLSKSRQYILDNPLKWDLDMNNPDNEEMIKDLKRQGKR